MAYESSYNDYSGSGGDAYGSYGYSFGDGFDDEISGGGREAGAYGKRSSSYEPYNPYSSRVDGLSSALDSMDFGGTRDPYLLADSYGGSMGRFSANESDTTGSRSYRSDQMPPLDTYGATDPYSTGFSHSLPALDDSHRRSSASAYGTGLTEYSHLGNGSQTYDSQYGLDPVDRDLSHSAPLYRRSSSRLSSGNIYGDPLTSSHSPHDSLGARPSSPLTGHSPGAFDYQGLPESFDLDPSYHGPRDHFGALTDTYSPYGTGLGGANHHHDTGARSAVDDVFGVRAGHEYETYGRGSADLGDPYTSRTPYNSAFEPSHNAHVSGPGIRFRAEDPVTTNGAFQSYMDRQDPYGYSGENISRMDGPIRSTTAYNTSLVPLIGSTLPHGSLRDDNFNMHHDTPYPGTHPQLDTSYLTRHSPAEEGIGLVFSSHTQTPFGGGLDTDFERHEPLYDYGSFAWRGRGDNEEERFHDLQLYKETLLQNEAFDDVARQAAWRERMEWEDLDNEARMARWRELDEHKRWELGLSQGYWGSTLEDDPLFYQRTVAPWSETGYIRPHQNFQISSSHPIYQTYNQFYSPTYIQDHADDYMNDKLLQAADLAAYSNALARDYSIREEERRRRWEDRLAWEALNQHERVERYRAMAEAERLRLGLGPHSYHSFHMGVSAKPERYFPHFERLQTLRYELSKPLQHRYAQFMGRPPSPSAFRRPDWEMAAAYYDLLRYENELRHARNLSEAQRQQLWRQRVGWQQLSEAQRQVRWLKMKQRERRLLGLDPNRYMGSRYATLGGGYRPGVIGHRPATRLQLEMPLNLQERFRPYKGRSFRLTNNPSWLTSALPGAKDVRNQLAEQKIRMAELNRRQAELHRLQAQKIRDREIESDSLAHELASGVKI